MQHRRRHELVRPEGGGWRGHLGQPDPVVDHTAGTVWLFLSWNAADKSQHDGTNPDTHTPTTAITKW